MLRTVNQRPSVARIRFSETARGLKVARASSLSSGYCRVVVKSLSAMICDGFTGESGGARHAQQHQPEPVGMRRMLMLQDLDLLAGSLDGLDS